MSTYFNRNSRNNQIVGSDTPSEEKDEDIKPNDSEESINSNKNKDIEQQDEKELQEEDDAADEYDEEDDFQGQDSRNSRESTDRIKEDARERFKNRTKNNTEPNNAETKMGRAPKNTPVNTTVPNAGTSTAGTGAIGAGSSTAGASAGTGTGAAGAGTGAAGAGAGAAGAGAGAAGAGAGAAGAGAGAGAAASGTGAAVGGASVLPYVLIAGVIIIALIFIIVLIYAIVEFIPGAYGDDESNYSKKDREILQKIAAYTQQHPNVDAAMALSVIYYPHNESIFGGNVLYYIEAEGNKTTTEQTTGVDEEVDENIEDKVDKLEEDAEGDISDINLEIIEDHLKEFGKVLQEMEIQGDNFSNYLKTDYFYNNKYYKRIMKRRVKGTDAQLANAIYEDIENLVINMQNYIQNYSNGNCTVSIADGGKINFDSTAIPNTYIQLVDSTCTGSFENCTASNYIGEPIDLKTYVMGVTYAEIGVSNDSFDEELKSQIIAAKSYTLSRSEVMGRIIAKKDGKTIRYMNNNTNDQVYCDIYTGCAANGAANAKPALSVELQNKLSTLYDSVANIYIYDNQSKRTYGAYVNSIDNEGSSCKLGSCMFQKQVKQFAAENKDYQTILFQSYSEEGRFALLDINDNSTSVGTVDCTISSAVNGVRTKAPQDGDKYFKSPYSNATNRLKFQCVWYARGRAQEIIDTSSLDQASKTKALKVLQGVSADGANGWWGWPTLDATFNSSNDVTKPKAGALVVWNSSTSQFGHVGIIESVEGDSVMISEGWRDRACRHNQSQDWSCLGFSYSRYSISQVKSGRYSFLGYYYLLEIKN